MNEACETARAAEAAEAVAAVALMAAFADGRQDRAERARLDEVFSTLGGVGVVALYRRVMLEETTLEAEAAKLRTSELQARNGALGLRRRRRDESGRRALSGSAAGSTKCAR